MRYAIYSLATHQLLRDIPELVYNPDTEGYTEVADSYYGEVVWCDEMLTYESPSDPNLIIPPLDFIRKFTTSERLAIHSIALTSPVIRDMLYMVLLSNSIDLCSHTTVNTLEYLQSQGLLTPERVTQIKGY